MGEITWEMRRTYGRGVDRLPVALIPRLDQDEILDRLDEAAALMRKFETAPGDLAMGYVERASQVCAAEPRDEVEEAAAAWIGKAEQAYTPQHAAGCREQARMIRAANPSAPRVVRRPSPEEVVHAEALATLKADIAAEIAEITASHNAWLDKTAVDVAEITAHVEVMRKSAEPGMTGVLLPDMTKAARGRR